MEAPARGPKKRTGSSKYDFVKVKVWLGDNLDHYYVLSRFLICRMLTVTKIPYIKAVKIALELKKHFVDANKLDVTQPELESVLFGLMAARGFDEPYIRCYRMVTAFYQQRQPLVILICGTAWTGKSSVAQQLAARINVPNVMQTDVMCDLLRAGGAGRLSPQSLWARGDLAGDGALLAEFKRECRVVRQAMQGDLVKALSDGKPIIIEGLHLDPALFIPEFARAGVIMLPARSGAAPKGGSPPGTSRAGGPGGEDGEAAGAGAGGGGGGGSPRAAGGEGRGQQQRVVRRVTSAPSVRHAAPEPGPRWQPPAVQEGGGWQREQEQERGEQPRSPQQQQQQQWRQQEDRRTASATGVGKGGSQARGAAAAGGAIGDLSDRFAAASVRPGSAPLAYARGAGPRGGGSGGSRTAAAPTARPPPPPASSSWRVPPSSHAPPPRGRDLAFSPGSFASVSGISREDSTTEVVSVQPSEESALSPEQSLSSLHADDASAAASGGGGAGAPREAIDEEEEGEGEGGPGAGGSGEEADGAASGPLPLLGGVTEAGEGLGGVAGHSRRQRRQQALASAPPQEQQQQRPRTPPLPLPPAGQPQMEQLEWDPISRSPPVAKTHIPLPDPAAPVPGLPLTRPDRASQPAAAAAGPSVAGDGRGGGGARWQPTEPLPRPAAGGSCVPLFVPVVVCMGEEDHALLAEEALEATAGRLASQQAAAAAAAAPGTDGTDAAAAGSNGSASGRGDGGGGAGGNPDAAAAAAGQQAQQQRGLREALRRARLVQDYLCSFEAQGLPVVRLQYGTEGVDRIHDYILQCIQVAMAL